MNDADLNALFAEKVAGWKLETVYNGVDGTSQKRLVKPGDIHANVRDENFTASMDAVAPYMEKWNESWEIAFYDGTWNIAVESPKGPMLYGWVKDKSLARACVLALLRANDVDIWE